MKYLTQTVLNTEMTLDIHDYIKIALTIVGGCVIISKYRLERSIDRYCRTADEDIKEKERYLKIISEKQAALKKITTDLKNISVKREDSPV